jgi:NAD(P)-dependent dehydrogenase (short-subunit alcohol dehydrogenase family)
MADQLVIFNAPGRVARPVLERLLEKGWRVCIGFREGGDSEKVVRELVGKYEQVLGVIADIMSSEGAEKFFNECIQWSGIPRQLALINVASSYPNVKDFKRWEKDDFSESDWKYIGSNFDVSRYVTKVVLEWYHLNPDSRLDIISFGDNRVRRYFKEDIIHPFGEKRLLDADIKLEDMVFLKSLGASGRDLNPYLLAKTLIHYMMREIALDNPGGRVRANTIAPGILAANPNINQDETERLAKELTLFEQIGGMESAAALVDYLLSDECFITGEIISLDGGQHLKWLSEKED